MRAAPLGLVIVALVGVAAPAARAQCGETSSSCWTCHEVDAQRAVLADGLPWHRDHAFADLCTRCHGGDPLAVDDRVAHVGLVAPLADPRVTCAGCHAGDADERAARYRAAAPSSTDATPATPAVSEVAARNDALAALVIGVLGLAGAAAIAIVEGRRAGRRPRFVALVRRPWSPYLAGALLGVVVTISVAVLGRRLSGAGAYQSLSGYLGAHLAPGGAYWTSIVHTGVGWDVWILIGTFAGALASAAAGRRVRLRAMPDARWIEAFGPRVVVRWLLVVAGTAGLSFAAGIAGGCTASLVLSGGAVLAPGAFVFAAAMFAGGVPVALLIERRARRHPR
jgi:uncharacterized protein